MNHSQLRKRSLYRIVFTLLVVAFSGLLAEGAYPHRAWLLGASLGVVAAITLSLRVGWTIPSMIAGTYAGLVADAHVKGGTLESQMWETVSAMVLGAMVGLFAGLVIDTIGCDTREDN